MKKKHTIYQIVTVVNIFINSKETYTWTLSNGMIIKRNCTELIMITKRTKKWIAIKSRDLNVPTKKTDITRTKFTRSVLTSLVREIQQANMNGDKKYQAKPLSLLVSMFD